MIENFWSQNKSDLQLVVKMVINEKYATQPNFEYAIDDSNKIRLKFECVMKIKHEFRLVKGESFESKIKAREDSIRKALKLLVPQLYAKFVSEQIEIFATESSIVSNSVIELNSSNNRSNSIHFTNSSIISEINKDSPSKVEFLRKKRKNESIEEEDEDECLFGGCLVEDVYAELRVDDPLIVDKYLSCSNFTPVTV